MTKILHPGCDHCNHPMFAAMRCDVCGKVHSTDDEPQQEAAAGYIYEWDSPLGVHQELNSTWWNGRECDRAIPYYTNPTPIMPRVMDDPEQTALRKELLASIDVQAMLSAAPNPSTTDDRKDAERTCTWKPMDDEFMPGTYEGSCGCVWSFIDGGVAENGLKFCPQCGGKVIAIAAQKGERE